MPFVTTTASPLVSLCMIMRDEASNLERCLASVAGVVGEVVIYDTGSTDGSIELARSLGATVIEGHWDDDFARARNEALRACRGTWILHLDADEELVADPDEFRALLRRSSTDSLLVRIRNVATAVGDYEHFVVRAFKRKVARWSGRLHERPVPKQPGRPLTQSRLDGPWIRHHGYSHELLGAKAERNLAIAEAELADGATGVERAELLMNVARCRDAVGDSAGALAACDEGLLSATGVVRRALQRITIESLWKLDRYDDAEPVIDELHRENPALGDLVHFLRGSARVLQHQLTDEFEAIGRLDEVRDEMDRTIPDELVKVRSGLAAYSALRWEAAADRLLEAVRRNPRHRVWAPLATAVVNAGADSSPTMDDVVAAAPLEQLKDIGAQVLLAHPEVGEAFAFALLAAHGTQPKVLAFVAHHGRRATIEQALHWATVLRQHGLSDSCPMLAKARDYTTPALDRFTAALMAHVAFRDAAAWTTLNRVAGELSEADEPAAHYLLSELAPELASA